MYTPLDVLSIETWILLISLIVLGRYYLHRKWKYFENMNIPYTPPSILNYGNFKQSFGKESAFEFDNRNKNKYGAIWGTFMFTTPTLTIHDPDILRKIFIKDFDKFPNRQKSFTKIGGKELNASLTVVEGEQWKRIRATMSPTFSTSKLKQMLSIIEWCADNAVAALNRKVEVRGGTFNAKETFSRLSLDIVCSAAFSTKVHSQDDREKEPEIVIKAKELSSTSFLSPLLLLCALFPPFENFVAKFDISLFGGKAVPYFRDLTNHILKIREENPHTQSRADLMQLMLNAQIFEEEAKKSVEKGMTTNEIVGNSMLMILAGYENTGSTLSFTTYNLAMNLDIQTKVQEEIDEMVKERGKFDYEGVMGLKLLENCINETLRLYNPILRNSRICEKEVTINGLTIPKGIQVNVPVFGLSRDPDYWDEPEEFKPDRMNDMSQIDPMVYQPFGAGPRNCIGMRFALLEIKMSLAKVLHKFTFEPTENTPKPPLKLQFATSVRSIVEYDLKAVLRENTT